MKEGDDIERVTLVDFEKAFLEPKYPRRIGELNQKDILLKKGKFGLYISWGENSRTLKELGNRPIENITFDDIVNEKRLGVLNILCYHVENETKYPFLQFMMEKIPYCNNIVKEQITLPIFHLCF